MTERSSEGLDVRRRKLLFRAWRRGVRETDLIVGRFADAYIDKFDEASLDQFERLIEVPNAELYAWVVGAETVPADYDTVVESRCAMTNTVRPASSRSMASCTRRSLSVSSAEVASSRIRTGGSISSARAIAMRWRWPPERRVPRSPSTVS